MIEFVFKKNCPGASWKMDWTEKEQKQRGLSLGKGQWRPDLEW